MQKGIVDILLGSNNLEFHSMMWNQRAGLILSTSRLGARRMMVAGKVDRSCLWLACRPAPRSKPELKPESSQASSGQKLVQYEKLYPDLNTESGAGARTEAGVQAGDSSPKRERSRSPSLILLTMVCLMLFCEGVCGFKAYDCQHGNVSTTPFSLFAPDTCLDVTSDLKYERQLSVDMIQVKRERSIIV